MIKLREYQKYSKQLHTQKTIMASTVLSCPGKCFWRLSPLKWHFHEPINLPGSIINFIIGTKTNKKCSRVAGVMESEWGHVRTADFTEKNVWQYGAIKGSKSLQMFPISHRCCKCAKRGNNSKVTRNLKRNVLEVMQIFFLPCAKFMLNTSNTTYAAWQKLIKLLNETVGLNYFWFLLASR